MKKDYINIVLTADNNYTRVVGVAMTSVLENLDKTKTARFFIFSYKFTASDIEELNKLKNKYDCEIINVPMEEHIHKFDFVNVNDFKNKWISIACYFRLLMFDILPKDVETSFYVDGDMIVDCDLAKINLDVGKIFRATIEASAMYYRESVLSHCYELAEFNKFKNDAIKYPYFNAGFFYTNLNKVRELKIYDYLIDLLKANPKLPFADQDLLNMAFGQKYSDLIEFLPPEYNIFADLDYSPKFDNIPITDDILKKAFNNPKVYHYAGEKKPWLTMDVRHFYNVWWKYYRLSPWGKDYYIKQFQLRFSKNEIKKIIRNIFSIVNVNNHKVISILGLKIKIKRKGK